MVAFWPLLTLLALVPPTGDERLSFDETVMLFQIGVPEMEITAAAERMGGFQPVRLQDLDALRMAGATPAFIDRLPKIALELGELGELAKHCDVFRDDAFGISFLYPAGWTITRVPAGEDSLVIRMTPEAVAVPHAFVEASLFVFVQRNSGLLPEVAEPVLGQLAEMVTRGLKEKGVVPRPGEPLGCEWFGSTTNVRTLEATVDRAGVGLLGVCLRIDPTGHTVGAGLSSGGGDREATVSAFRQMLRTMTLSAPN